MHLNVRKTNILLLLCLFLAIGASAQKGIVSGRVTDAQTGEGLPEALVSAGEVSVNTNEDGYYEIRLKEGDYELTATYVGFDPVVKKVTVEEDEEVAINFEMGEMPGILDQVTVTATKFEKPIGKATVSLDIVKPELIDNSNATAVDQVLEKVPGVTIIDGQANIRGGSGYSYGAGSRVMLLVDDMPFLQGDAGYPNWRDVPVENINQVEVLKGAASALYGSAALNGIINIRTAYAGSEPVTRAAMYTTVFNKPKDKRQAWWGDASPFNAGAQFAHRQKFGNFDLVLGGNVYYDNGFRKEEYNRKARLNGNLRYRFGERLSIGCNFNINGGPSGSVFVWGNGVDVLNLNFLVTKPDTLMYQALEGTSSTSKTFRYNIDPYITFFDKAGGRHKIQTRYYYINNNNTNNQANESSVAYAEYQYQRKFTELADLVLVAGAVGTYTYSNSQLFGNAEYNISNAAAYLQLDKDFGDKLTVSAGVRYEFNTINSPDSLVNPGNILSGPSMIFNPETKSREGRPVFRVGLNYQPAEYTYIRGSWGQGYRFPTVAERYVATLIGGALSIAPNPTLQSETGWSAELGLKQGFKVSKWMGYLDVALFWTEYQNMMEFNFLGTSLFDFAFVSQNIGNTRIRGFEVSVLGTGEILGAKTNVIGGYTFLNPQFKDWTDGGKQDSFSSANFNFLKYRSRHSAKIDIETFFGQFSIGAAIIWNSRMEAIDEFFSEPGKLLPEFASQPSTWDWFGVAAYRNKFEKNGWYQLDFRAAWYIRPSVKLSVIAENITNNMYTIRPALAGAPRNYTLRMDYNF